MTPPTTHPLLTATQLGLLLRAARKRRGLTQAEVGARLGLSQNRVSHLEGHADELSVKQLLTWCAVVGLELSVAERQSLSSETKMTHPGPTPASTDSSSTPDTPPEW